MYFSDRVTLRTVVPVINSAGFHTSDTPTDTEVWADIKSATRSEFYAAMSNGRSIDIVFAIHAEDFANQTQAVYNSVVYDIVRSYQKGLGIVELMCSRLSNG